MADWSGFSRGLEAAYPTAGRQSGLAATLSAVVSRLKEQQDQKQALNLLGQTEGIKEKIKAQYAGTGPKAEAEIAKEKAQANYYNSLSDLNRDYPEMAMGISSGSRNVEQGVDNQPSASSMVQYPQEDYILEDTTRSFKGRPIRIKNPKLKEDLSDKQQEGLASNVNLLGNLNAVKELSLGGAKTGFFTASNPAMPFGGKYLKQKGSKEDIDLNQILRQSQSQYITAQTGAQRGFAEMKWFDSAMPTGDMPPEKIQGMIDNTLKMQELNVRNILISADRNGKRLGKDNREMLSQLIEKYPLEENPFVLNYKPIKAGQPAQNNTQSYSPGETRNINGTTYVRDANGNWSSK